LAECYEFGVNAYVVKPVDFQDFIKAVKELGVFLGGHQRTATIQCRRDLKSKKWPLLLTYGYEEDLLFPDIVMPPQMDGKELSDGIRAVHPQTEPLVTSAYTENAASIKECSMRASRFCKSHYTPSALALKNCAPSSMALLRPGSSDNTRMRLNSTVAF